MHKKVLKPEITEIERLLSLLAIVRRLTIILLVYSSPCFVQYSVLVSWIGVITSHARLTSLSIAYIRKIVKIRDTRIRMRTANLLQRLCWKHSTLLFVYLFSLGFEVFQQSLSSIPHRLGLAMVEPREPKASEGGTSRCGQKKTALQVQHQGHL